MKSLVLLLLGAATAFSQPFTLGVKAGVPLTDFTDAVSRGSFDFSSKTQRYIVGPTVELRLPFGLGIEADALYRRFSYNGTIAGVTGNTTIRTTGNAWEFPILAKYRFPAPIARPYIAGGIAWDTLQGLTQDIRNAVGGSSSTSTPSELNKKTTTGFVIGAGLDVKAIFIHISPEIRYTRWGARHFLDPNGGISSNRNQAEFLVGFTF
jgi:opacity protein-like surface antigen